MKSVTRQQQQEEDNKYTGTRDDNSLSKNGRHDSSHGISDENPWMIHWEIPEWFFGYQLQMKAEKNIWFTDDVTFEISYRKI